MDLLSSSNSCGQTLLQIVSRGSSIIAEIQRLSQYIPEDFLFPKDSRNHPYKDILFDYDYFGNESVLDDSIDNDPRLSELNDECRETHLELVDRFCRLFESVVRYALDLVHYLDQIENNFFLQITLETLMTDTEGKQLMGEALYLYGVMLLQLDHHIPGIARERLLVAFNRWRGPAMLRNYSKVCEVCRSTGYVPGKVLPTAYPVDYLNRTSFPSSYVSLLISRYRNDDVYLSMSNYPDTEHRAVALSTQASMLFVFLFFSPNLLKDGDFIMREIVDKFFFDNWIVPYFMGYTFDLTAIWAPFKSAQAALSTTFRLNSNRHYSHAISSITSLHQRVKEVLSEGFTQHEVVLENMNSYVKLVRDSNVILRFCTLHTQSPSKKVPFPLDRDALLAFLLDLAEFEFELRQAFQHIVDKKTELMEEERSSSEKLLSELAFAFSGALSSIQKDTQLEEWFSKMSREFSSLTLSKIVQLKAALEKVQTLRQISSAIFIKESVGRVVSSLKSLALLISLDEKTLPLLSALSDFSYGLFAARKFIPLMQSRIKADPFSVLKLRATFLKMASVMDLQLVRIIQCGSPDVESVGEHYSSVIVDFVRQVLEVVPASIFGVLDEIIYLKTNTLINLPHRIERAKMKQYAQLEERARLAKLTKEVSILTTGVLAMKTTLMGIITVDPKKVLEEGIRKQLVSKIIQVLYSNLQGITPAKFSQTIEATGKALEGIRSSFEYMGDYVSADGLKIWHHEYSRIMAFLVEQESNQFVRKKVLPQQSEYQSKEAPIILPQAERTCIGNLAGALMALTNMQNAVYCGVTGGWLSVKTGEEALGTKAIERLVAAVGVEGASAVDEILGFHLAKRLKQFFGAQKGVLGGLTEKFLNGEEDYNELFARIKPSLTDATRTICEVGQLQLLRASIDSLMDLSCKLDAEGLHSILKGTNDTVLQAIKQFYRNPSENPYPSSTLICGLATYLENCGICQPLEKIYTNAGSVPDVALALFGWTVMNLNHSKLRDDDRLKMLVREEGYAHYEFVVGVITILRQVNVSHMYAYLTYMGQYVNNLLSSPGSGKREMAGGVEVVRGLKLVLLYMKDFEKLSKSPRRMVDTFIPPTIFDFLSV